MFHSTRTDVMKKSKILNEVKFGTYVSLQYSTLINTSNLAYHSYFIRDELDGVAISKI